jgi:hypothetical protein
LRIATATIRSAANAKSPDVARTANSLAIDTN